ncbi:MAG: hypothetical protein K6U74_02000 [Firmicutes bacterium]|nr:hypothetical protein [Bacillota bacterium]
MEKYLKQARACALGGRIDEAINCLISALWEMADRLNLTPAAVDPDEPVTLSEEAKRALWALRKIFFHLSAAIQKREWDLLANGYPFHLSFDELTDGVAKWVEAHCDAPSAGGGQDD